MPKTKKSSKLSSNSPNKDIPSTTHTPPPTDHIYTETMKQEALDKLITDILIQSKQRIESTVEDIKLEFNQKMDSISTDLQLLCRRQTSLSIQNNKKPFGRKEFIPRESLLSKMLHYDDENYKTIFNIMVCFIILWGVGLAFEDINTYGLPNFDLLIWGVVRDIQPFMQYWLMMVVSSFTVVLLAHFSAECKMRFMRTFFIVCYTVLQIGMFVFSAWAVNSHAPRFAMPLAAGLMCEQARMSMKMHSYFREKIMWRRYNGKFACQPKSTGHFLMLPIPDLDYIVTEGFRFLEFIFIPTLVYRDNYPRTSRIRWDYVVVRSLEFIAMVYFAFLLFRAVLPPLESSAGTSVSLTEYTRLSFNCMGPSMAIMFMAHFLVLHTVQNIGAELTRFADRQFYQDWWTARTFSVFYRKWNGVVHDFIHSYMYMDMVELLKMNKTASLLLSFILSAVIHEYIICFSMGFFLPILGVLFTGPGLIFILLTKNKTGRLWNIFMWMMLALGNGQLLVMYAREYYSRELYSGSDLSSCSDSCSPEELQYRGYNDFWVPLTLRMQFPHIFGKVP